MAKFSISQLMNEKSKSEAEQVKQPFDVVLIPLDNLVPSEENKYGIRDVEELAENIEFLGLLHNLDVKPASTPGKYSIISGERRYEALKLLVSQGKTQYGWAPCKIEGAEEENPEINELRLLFANATARDFTDYERTYQAQRIKELLLSLKQKGYKFQGRMRQIVADMLEMSPAQVGRMESINGNLLPEFKEEFKNGKIGVTAAYELSRLPEEQQAQEMADYQQTGAVEIKDIQQKREQAKPQPAEKPPQPTAAQSKPAPSPSVPSAPAAPVAPAAQPAEHEHPAERHARGEIWLDDCPHCGGKAKFQQFANPKNFYDAKCTVCGCETDGYRICRSENTARQNMQASADVWNRRV